MFKEDKSKIES